MGAKEAVKEVDSGRVPEAPPQAIAKPMGFEPENLSQAFQLAEWLSKSSLLPKDLIGKPQDVLIVMMKGRELGLKPMQAFGSISVINGKAVCEAVLLGALVKASPLCDYLTLIESTDAKATFETRRKGKAAVKMSFTIEQAKNAKLLSKDNWQNYPAAMLRARALSHLCKAEWQDVILGLTTPDEVESPIDVDPFTGEVLNAPEPAKPAKVVPLSQTERLERALAPPAPVASSRSPEQAGADMNAGAAKREAAVAPAPAAKAEEVPVLRQLATGRDLKTLTPDEIALGMLEADDALKKNPRSADVQGWKKKLAEEQARRFGDAPEPGSDG
jgi:hypothetical protein